MADFTTHPAGTFCYVELASPDPDATAAFYTGLFGWERNDQDLGPAGAYTLFTLRERLVAAQFRIPPAEARDGLVPHWGQYVAVPDADAAAARAAALGATVVLGPLDVLDYGRMAVLRDPQGAGVNLWEGQGNPGIGVLDEVGALCWNELLTRDPDGARAFYTELFAWQPEPLDVGEDEPYVCWMRGGERPAGGMLRLDAARADLPAGWLPYFQVADPDAVADRAAERGAGTLVVPKDIPGAGRLAVLTDPGGAAFGIYLSRH